MTRRRSRYAPDDQVRRVAKLAAEMGIKAAGIRLGADGSVVLLDASALPALTMTAGDADAALAEFEDSLEPSGRA